MNVFVVWTNYEDIGGVFSTREKAEAFIDRHMKSHNDSATLFKRTREAYSNIMMTLDISESEE